MLTMTQQQDDRVELRLEGRLTGEDYRLIMQPVRALLLTHARLRLLVEIASFEGWDVAGLLQEARFDLKLRDQIDKVALVGEPAYESWSTRFGKELYPARVRYFSNLLAARMWIEQPDPPAATDVHRAASV